MSEARRFLEKSARPSCSLSPLKLQRHLVRLLAIWTRLPTAYTDLSAAFYLLHKAVGNSAMNTNLETVTNGAVNFLYPGQSVGNGAMNASRYWQRRNERSSLLEAVQIMPSGLLRPVQLHYSEINFSSAFAIPNCH
jgi:hypothetical protein